MKKELVTVSIALHPVQVGLIKGLQSGKINLQKDSLRDIARKCGQKNPSPQQIVHHMKQLLKLGVLQYINGQYVYLKHGKENINHR